VNEKNNELKLNLGCASRLLPGYVNIDIDSFDDIKLRYPNVEISADEVFLQGDFFNLDFEDGSVDEIRAEAMLEHLSFLEESKFFYEVKRLLKPGGLLNFSVPDFDNTIQSWIEAKDDWKDFFRNDDEAIKQEHWFGNCSYSIENKWGYLTASIFGSQNGIGQFHKNAYTESKIRAICAKIGFNEPEIERFKWKGRSGDVMLSARVTKK
jgi:predicted SAM-dependent methyltransferase